MHVVFVLHNYQLMHGHVKHNIFKLVSMDTFVCL